MAEERFANLAAGTFYAPLDYVWAVRRVLRTLQPSLVLITETEIWPNLFRETKRTDAALAIVNGRISDDAFPRYRSFAWLFRRVLGMADIILVQTQEMRARFVALGADPEQVSVSGNFKYDIEPRAIDSHSPLARLLEGLRPAKIWIAASTMPGVSAADIDEDAAVLSAFQHLSSQHPGLLLILAPRKPEQFPIAARKLEASGLQYLRRSQLAESQPISLPAVLLLDSIGELAGVFHAADVVFMGGTLASRGGHNIIEPALFAKPVIVGPHMENFRSITEDFRRAGALVEIQHPGELTQAVDRLLADSALAAQLGERAQTCAMAQRGATARAVTAARELYTRHVPRYLPAQPWYSLRWLLGRLWNWGARRHQARALAAPRRLTAPVISIGNVTMGGTGKTPCALRLAADLVASGLRPGILTRGYRRRSTETCMTLPAGAKINADRTGDEAQLFLRAAVAPVGIGGDRYQTGVALEQRFGLDVLLLDDGFQHARLDRSIDLVLLDAMNPFGGGHVFPLGRLREPLEALARADLFLLTRTDLSDMGPAIEYQVRRWNTTAPIFHGHLAAKAWLEHSTGKPYPLEPKPFDGALAFCGVGNPASFRRTLEALGVNPAGWMEFPDHHRYRPRDLRRMVRKANACAASALITTAKDGVNLAHLRVADFTSVPLYGLEVELCVDKGQEMLDVIRRALARDAGSSEELS